MIFISINIKIYSFYDVADQDMARYSFSSVQEKRVRFAEPYRSCSLSRNKDELETVQWKKPRK